MKFPIAQAMVADSTTVIALYGCGVADLGTKVARQCDVTNRSTLKQSAHECLADSGL